MTDRRGGLASMLAAALAAAVLGRRLVAGFPLFASGRGGRFRRMKEKKKGGGERGRGKKGKKGK